MHEKDANIIIFIFVFFFFFQVQSEVYSFRFRHSIQGNNDLCLVVTCINLFNCLVEADVSTEELQQCQLSLSFPYWFNRK